VTSDVEAELTVRLRSLTWEADGVLSLVLEDPQGGVLPDWRPGAHLDLQLPGGSTRQYSLCGDPRDHTRYRVAVLREAAGRGGSELVHTSLRPGELLTVRGPRNLFALVPASRYLFIAGGIGITPILVMVQEAERSGADWKLLYGGRTRASMAFTAELTSYGDKVFLAPQDEHGLLPLTAWLGAPHADTKVYCCGPEGLLSAVEALCHEHWPPESLHVERFAPKPGELAPADGDQPFEVVCQASGQRLEVKPDCSIMEALRQAGIEVPSSCEEGICGTCETGVLEGVPDHRDSILSDEERAAGRTMFVCVSRALTPRLVLDR